MPSDDDGGVPAASTPSATGGVNPDAPRLDGGPVLDEVHHAKVALLQLRTSGHATQADALHALLEKHEALLEEKRVAAGKPPSAHKQASQFSQQLGPQQPKAPTPGEKQAEANKAAQSIPPEADSATHKGTHKKH